VGYLYALLGAVLFGLNGSVTKVLIEAGLSPSQVTLARVAGTALISGIVLLFLNRRAFRVPLRLLPVLALLGVVGIALLQFSYAIAVTMLPVGIALLFEYTAVLMVALVAFLFFKEQVKARLWAAIACVLVGLAVVAQVWTATLDGFGVVMAFTAAVFWTMTSAAVFWLIFGDWWRLSPGFLGTPVSLSGNLDSAIVPLWVPLLWNIVIGSFAPFLLSLLALKHLSATAVGIVASSEVIFAFVFAWIWLREGLGILQLAGAAIVIVIVGIVLAQTARADKVVDPDLALTAGTGQPIR
jgi:drug/metabolite transporter (DMT)-like permease